MISENTAYCSAMKQIFVENPLAAVLREIDENVESVSYYCANEPSFEEYVIIDFAGGGIKRVCITADSLTAVVRDVLKVFE